MGFLDKALGFIGIGQPEVVLNLDDDYFERGDVFGGRVEVKGGNRELELSGVNVSLVQEQEVETDDGGTRTRRDDVLEEFIPTNDLPLSPEDSFEVPFKLQIPEDVEPSSFDVSYKLEGAADVPGWDPEAEHEIKIDSDRSEWTEESLRRNYLMEDERDFRYSSIRGDYRLFPIPGGFVAGWKDVGVARSNDGSSLWRNEEFGRTFALSPDEEKLAVADNDGRLVLLDPKTGDQLQEPFVIGERVNSIAWISDEQFVITGSGEVDVYNSESTSETFS